MMAFSAMLEGPSEQTLLPMIFSAFPKIIQLLKDPSKVKKICSLLVSGPQWRSLVLRNSTVPLFLTILRTVLRF